MGRLATLLAVTVGLAVCSAAVRPPSARSAGLTEGTLVPYIVGGQESSISQLPWQVYIQTKFEENGNHLVAACGGSILDATHILTAAHCVDAEGTTVKRPPSAVTVVAGDSNVSGPSSTTQVAGVSSIRTHPYYTPLPQAKDDAAVLTLSKALTLSPAADAQAIPLVASGATPAPGSTLTVSGYGLQSGAEGAEPNNRLYSTSLTAISSDACRGAVGVNSAVLLCAVGPSSTTCQGDSGGPLTQGNPPVQVGIVDFGLRGCPVGQPDAFTSLAAPEVRAFVEGSESPPLAPRPTAPPVIRSVGSTPVDYSPLTCDPGAWSGSPSFTYTFQVEDAAAQVLLSGAGNVFVPPSSLIDFPLVCIVRASNPGGLTTIRSATSPPISADSARPVASITALRCHLRACTLALVATDPNSVALGVQSKATYALATKCPPARRKAKGRKAPRRSTCHRTATVHMPLSRISSGAYRATATGLPYNKRVTFTVLVTNAAGLRPARSLTRSTTLRPPSKTHRTSRKSKRAKR